MGYAAENHPMYEAAAEPLMSDLNKRLEIEVLKHRFLDFTLLGGSILAFIVLALSLFPFTDITYNYDFYTDLISVAALFGAYILRNTISVNLKSNLILIILFTFIFTDLTENGLEGTDKIALVLIPFFTVLVYDLKRSVIYFGIAIAGYTLVAWMIINGVLEVREYSDRSYQVMAWILTGGVTIIVAGVITVFTHRFHNALIDLVSDLEMNNQKLERREKRLKDAQEFARMGSWEFDLKTEYLKWSDELFKIFELKPLPPRELYKKFRERIHPEDVHILDDNIRIAAESVQPVDFEHRILLDDGRIKYIGAHIEVIADEEGKAARFVGIGQDITDSAEAERELRNRERLLTAITDNFPRSYLAVVDRDLTVRFTGGAEFQAQGIDYEEFIDQKIEDVFQIAEESLNHIREAYKATLAGDEQSFEIKISDQYLLFRTIPLQDEIGDIYALLAVVENVTERKEIEQTIKRNLEEKEILLQEIHHRVKNNLAVVSGLLELQAYRLEKPETIEMMNKSTNRILSIAKVHEMLYQSSDFTSISFSGYVEELSQIIMNTMNKEDKEIDILSDIQVETININQGVPLGIIFNELITNSIKYGFKGHSGHEISIKVKEIEDGRVEVIYKDNGVGIKKFDQEKRSGLGITLVENLLEQLDAEYKYRTDDGFQIQFLFKPFYKASAVEHLNS